MKTFLKKNLSQSTYNLIKNIYQAFVQKEESISKTSISDNQKYPDFCIKASLDSKTFSNFRTNKTYQEILEHVDFESGQVYIQEIKKNNSKLLVEKLEGYRENDKWGSPQLFNYSEIGNISSTTLRYIKVYSDLISLFKSIDSFNICEIGVGYGGQCRVVNVNSSPANYTLVDIKPALMLAQTYLDNYALNSVLRFKTMNELEVEKYDLVISNYAFTELPRAIQDVYLKKIILNSRNGYITYNEVSPIGFKSYSKDELLSIIPNSRVIDEVPLSHPKNCIIVWNE